MARRRSSPLDRLTVALPVAAAVAGVLAAALWAGAFRGFRAQASDSMFPSGATDSRIAVVGIDRQALAATGRWPWPRATQARLFAAIGADHPRLVVADIVYNPATDEDARLAAAISQTGDVVVASAPQLQRSPDTRLLQERAVVEPVATIGDAASAVGESAITPDPGDGVVRSLPLAVETPRGAFVPSLSLAALARIDHLPESILVRPHGLQLGSTYVPTDRHGRLRVGYSAALTGAPARRATISAADVMKGRAGADRLRGKIVFVGVTDPALGDTHSTAAEKGNGAPGVFIHANALNTMLTRDYLAVASRGETLLWVIALALVVAIAVVRWRVWMAAAVAVASAAAYVLFAFYRFDGGTEMDLVYPLLAVALAFVGALGGRYALEARERRRMAGLLEQYVPATVARQLLARDRGGMPTGTVTFLFTDVVGSTEAWEQFPQAMSQAMRSHDTLIEEEVERCNGAVVRPRGEGDSRFGVFLDPADGARAALAIDRAMASEPWPTPRPVQVRMGLHTGEVELREGDYYGSPVNRCARIRSLAGPGQIMVSEVTTRLIESEFPADSFEDRGMHELKGIAEPEHVFELRTQATNAPH